MAEKPLTTAEKPERLAGKPMMAEKQERLAGKPGMAEKPLTTAEKQERLAGKPLMLAEEPMVLLGQSVEVRLAHLRVKEPLLPAWELEPSA